jgi:carboxymethylenebutenolidase
MISAPDLRTDTVEFRSDGTSVRAALARPAGPGPAPAVLIAHEWWGLTDYMRELAQRFAQAGYAALAPDLYARQPAPPGAAGLAGGGPRVTSDPAEAARLMNELSAQWALRDLNAAASFLKQQTFVDPQRVAIVGFSMGGTLALTQATHNSDLKAAVVFYGKVPPVETLAYLLCPVLYHYAAKDDWVTRQEVDRLRDGCAKLGKTAEVAIYPDADHAFFNSTRPDVYRAQDAARAWDRTLGFLAEYLR